MRDRISFNNIMSWTPAIDARAIGDGDTYVLTGRNYVFDSLGPKAYFASRLLNQGTPIMDTAVTIGDVHSLGGFIFTTTGIGRFGSTGNFEEQYVFAEPIVGAGLLRQWTRAYVAGAAYFCHPSVGILKYVDSTWTTVDVGLVAPQAVTSANGRLQVMTLTVHAWSSAGSPEDFTPALGGAGFITIANTISGEPIAMIGMPQAVIVWTTQGGIVAEYVAGDIVYRHYPLEHQHIPISDTAITRLADGSYVICTNQGLYNQPISGAPSSIDAAFNEWFRGRLSRIPVGGRQVRLTYDSAEDQLYVQLRDWSQPYNETYVLAVALGKWGEFNRPHRGIIQHSYHPEPVNMSIGYIDDVGTVHRFLRYGTKCEVTPGVFVGLDSTITLGPFRSFDQRRPAFMPTVDSMLEIQAVSLGVHSRPTNNIIEIVNLDLESGIEDLNSAEDELVNLMSEHMKYPESTFRMRVVSDLSGADMPDASDPLGDNESCLLTTPELIRETPNVHHYSLLAPGIWHRIILSAQEVNEYFHVTYGEITVDYSGQHNT